MYVMAVVMAASALYGENRRRSGVKKARKQALEDEQNAREAEVFAETEGEGTGQLGKISLELDDEIKTKKSKNVSI